MKVGASSLPEGRGAVHRWGTDFRNGEITAKSLPKARNKGEGPRRAHLQ